MTRKEEKFIKYVHNTVGKTIYKHSLIQKDDHVLVGLSGGKDSLVLLETLAERKKYLPFKFNITATHILIDNIGYETDIKFLETFCKSLGVRFILKKFTLENIASSKKSTCFLCSWNRRKAIFELTKEINCNKLAFGHHMDDALETMLMNMIYHGSVSSLPYKLSMFDGRVEVIRPLLEFTDEQMDEFAQIKDYPKEIRRCPYDKETGRESVSKLLDQVQKIYDQGKKNMFRSLSNQYPEYLPQYKK
jgi:tRNA(Ile)-lysidine synthase TilS/MesJ